MTRDGPEIMGAPRAPFADGESSQSIPNRTPPVRVQIVNGGV